MSLFSVLLGTMKTDFLIGGPKGIMLRKVTNGFEVRSFDGSALKNLTVDSLTANTSVLTDTITEKTVDAGVTVDGVLIKDGLVDGMDVSTLAVDSTVIKKDGTVAFTAAQSMGGFKLTSVADPTVAQDAATKAYVDSVAQGLTVHSPVRLATADVLPACTPSGSQVGKTLTADANGALSIDGVAVVIGDRILIKNQVAGADNGIYVVTAVGDVSNPFILTRATDFDGSPASEVVAGSFFFVEVGNTLADAGFVLSTNNPITIDTTALEFSQFSGAGQILAGNGLTKTGNTLDVNVDATTIEISTDTLRIKDGGISTAKLANDSVDKDKINADVAGAGLGQNVDGSLEVKVDASTIEINSDTLRVKAGGITNNEVSATAAIEWSKIDKTSSSLGDLATRAYSDLTGRPADDDFNTLTEETSIADGDFLPIYDASATAYRKMQKSNLVAGLAVDSTVVHLAGENLTVDSLTANTSVLTDTITEKTVDAGVTIETVLIKDGLVDGMDVSTLAVDSSVVHLSGAETVTGQKDFSGGIKSDNILESTLDAGVTVDGVLIKDGLVDGMDVSTLAVDSSVVHLAGTETVTGDKSFSGALKVDTVSELTLDAGVTVDGVLIKDSKVSGSYVDIANLTALTSPDDSDELLINDVSAGANKKITRANLLSGIATANGLAKHIAITVSTSSVSSTTSIPENAIIKSVTTIINSVYSAGTTLQVIVDGTTDLEIQATGDNDAETTNVYESRPFSTVAAANVGVARVVVAGSPVIGSATVIVEYVEAPLA